MKAQIIQALMKHPGVSDYILNTTEVIEANTRSWGNHPLKSSNLSTYTQFEVTVFNRHIKDGGNVIGASTGTLVKGQDIGAKIEELVAAASGLNNPVYDLPSDNDFPQVEAGNVVDLSSHQDMLEQIAELRSGFVRRVQTVDNLRISHLEIALAKIHHDLVSSTGLETGYDSTRALLNLTLLGRGAQGESDLVIRTTERGIGNFIPEEVIEQYANLVISKADAQMADSYTGPVVMIGSAAQDMLLAESLMSFISPVIHHASGETKHNGSSKFEVGKNILQGDVRGDTLTITSDPLMPGMMRTRPYDLDGSASRRVVLIKNGILQQFYCDAQFSQYIGGENTSGLGNIIVDLGTRSLDQLTESNEPILVVAQWSAFSPNSNSGDFGSEVRCGYMLYPDGTRKPISKTTVSGNVFKALACMRLSSEEVISGPYKGPNAIRVESVKVTGK